MLAENNACRHLTPFPPCYLQKRGTGKNWRRRTPALWGPPTQSRPATHTWNKWDNSERLTATTSEETFPNTSSLQNLDELRDVVGVQEVPDAPVDAHWNGDVLHRNDTKSHWVNHRWIAESFFSAKRIHEWEKEKMKTFNNGLSEITSSVFILHHPLYIHLKKRDIHQSVLVFELGPKFLDLL